MSTAAAARTFWAALRRRSRKPMPASGSPALRIVASHASSYVLMALAAIMVVCAAAGLAVTVREDQHLSAERHAAVQRAVDELQGAPGGLRNFGEGEIEMIARRTGLPDLRFDAADGGVSGREVQSLHDAQGRIVGWFSWTPDRTLILDLIWLWGLIGGFGALLGICALLAAGMIQRLARLLAKSTRTIRKLTREDALTGLPNHRVMLENLENALAKRRTGGVVLALIDLDGFREVNDTQGRAGGDALFKAIAERLQEALPPGAIFGRFEDDEFAVIASNADIHTAAGVAESLRTALSRPVFLEQDWQISAGIGIAQAPADGKTGEELSRRAGLALRAAKRKGRGTVQQFEPYIEMEDSEERFIRRELQSALSSRALEVHYQPVVAAAGGGIVGVEALLRWTHPARGAIAPSVFIPLAERSGLMGELGAFVLRRALADAMRWPALSVAVNLSPVQIRDPGIVALVAGAIRDAEITPSRVVLEITEGVLIDDPQATLQRLDALRALGVSIALDDFGTGYSSLSYLQKFPFSQLKIDRAFVVSLGATGNAGAIIQSIVTLGHALGLKVLAEGVETDEQRVLLRLAGCDEMQGFLFAKPQPAEAIDKVVARAAAARRATRQTAVAAR